MLINENQSGMWKQMLTEEFGCKDASKLEWISELASTHAIYESALGIQGTIGGGQTVLPSQGVSPLNSTPLNTIGMGNVAAPGQPGVAGTNLGAFGAQGKGSGDLPISTLPVALNVALMTIGFELLPVVPTKSPWIMLSYMDFPYAGGKIGGKNMIAGIDGVGTGRENKPLYFKLISSAALAATIKAGASENEEVVITTDLGTVTGYYKTIGRMDGNAIFEVAEVKDGDGNDASLKSVLEGATVSSVGSIDISGLGETDLVVGVDYAQTQVDFIDGFANFATGEKKAMSRGENETGTGNTIGLRLFSKWLDVGSYEVTGSVTRQQLQDLPLMGVDAVGKVLEAMQNELTQHINARILSTVFAMGVTNATRQKSRGVDLNLHMGTADTTMADTSIATYADINGVEHKESWGTIANAEVTTSAENLHTRQRRIISRIQAVANLINQTGRRGRATWAVTNAKIATALQDNAGFVICPADNNLDVNGNLYHAGKLNGLDIYVDPYMDWNDTRICVGRKGDGNSPGLVFCPYILADTVNITAEGTMAPKMVMNSRFAIAPIGFYPELMYYTFVVDCPEFEIV